MEPFLLTETSATIISWLIAVFIQTPSQMTINHVSLKSNVTVASAMSEFLQACLERKQKDKKSYAALLVILLIHPVSSAYGNI